MCRPVPALYLEKNLREMIKKGDNITHTEAEVLDAYFNSGDAFIERQIEDEEREDYTSDEYDSELEEELLAEEEARLQLLMQGAGVDLDWDPVAENA